ncbi:MAG: glycine cleavage system aminomethyltransferase GcvT [Dongiaceae bacterium]
MNDPAQLKTTPLHSLHRALGARMVPFAGYDMPVQYPAGIIAEHRHTRSHAGLFDVSHMGQVRIRAANSEAAAAAIEALVPADYRALKPGRQRYGFFTNEAGGILDDLMVAHGGDHFLMVVNASRKDADFAHLQANLPKEVHAALLADRALLALQGPEAVTVIQRHAPETVGMRFMDARAMTVLGTNCFVTRSGYTGEDGFELSVPADQAERLARRLLDEPEVMPIGLGARDSLRLEAGLCLYGNDIDETTTPVEAGIEWAIGKRRRAEGGFPGAKRILAELAEGPKRRRVGLLPQGRSPVRAHSTILDASGVTIGEITSGGFGPSLEAPIAMGYVPTRHARPGEQVSVDLRGKPVVAEISAMPFVQTRYHRD